MKKKAFFFLLFVLLIIIMVSFINYIEERTLQKHISTNINELKIEVLPEMELLSIVQYLSQYHADFNLMTQIYFQYKKDIELHFRKYEEHPVVGYFEELYKKGFNFEKPPTIMLFMNNDFSLNESRLLDKEGIYKGENNGYGITKADLEILFKLMRDFYLETDFQEFFTAHKSYYKEIISDTALTLSESDVIYSLEEFYGEGKEEYRLILVSLFHNGGYGAEVLDSDKGEVYAIIGPNGRDAKKDIPHFGEKEFLLSLLFHEFGHSFIELSTESTSPLVKESEYLFEEIKRKMTQRAYSSWESTLEETILRAAVIYMMSDDYPETTYKSLEEEYSGGFIYINEVYDLLEEYKDNLVEYKDFQSYIPIIINELMNRNR